MDKIMDYSKLNDMARRFLSGQEDATVRDYFEKIRLVLETLSPKNSKDERKIKEASTCLKEVVKKSRRMEEEINILKRRINILEEDNEH